MLGYTPSERMIDEHGNEASWSESPARHRHTIAVGGGRGGVGKTLLSVNLAVYLAQLGRNVVLCDADARGSNLHTSLGLHTPPLAPVVPGRREAKPELVNTTVPGLKLLPTSYDRYTLTPKRPTRHTHWTRQLRDLDADYIVLNLGSSVAPATLDVFFEADVHICVAAPEPAAIEATYRFCRALFARRLRRAIMKERFKIPVVERALEELPPLPSPRRLIAEIARYDESVANIAASTLRHVRPRLVVGKTRLRRDLELGPAMASLSERYLGMALDYMGYVEQDDAVWLTARRERPLLIDAPTSKAARNIERVARRLLALLAQPRKLARNYEPIEASTLNAPSTLYQALGVARTASDDEIRRAYKLQRDIFKDGSLPLVGIVDKHSMRAEQARISEAYDTLLDPQRRRTYDLSVFPDDENNSPPSRQPMTADAAELAQLRSELAREITPETQFTGAMLAKARKALGVDIQEIANITKISLLYLRALEAENFTALPALVYVRGFLKQVAKALQLDPIQVSKTYLKRLRAVRPDYE